MVKKRVRLGVSAGREVGRRCGVCLPLALMMGSVGMVMPKIAMGQHPVTLNGPPVQVTPYVLEPGLPNFMIPLGTPTFPPTDGGTTGAGASGSDLSSGSDALSTMFGTSWGTQAAANAQSIGVNASALAATCVLETGCQNVSGSGAQGVFQMYPAAFQEGLQAALQANPQLTSQIVSGAAGMNDPMTEGIAAAGYLLEASQALENAGITAPTILDTRAYYNFGPSVGAQLAQASASDLMSQYVSPSVLAANGISENETVGQWQSSVSNKIGGAAGQTVLM